MEKPGYLHSMGFKILSVCLGARNFMEKEKKNKDFSMKMEMFSRKLVIGFLDFLIS